MLLVCLYHTIDVQWYNVGNFSLFYDRLIYFKGFRLKMHLIPKTNRGVGWGFEAFKVTKKLTRETYPVTTRSPGWIWVGSQVTCKPTRNLPGFRVGLKQNFHLLGIR